MAFNIFERWPWTSFQNLNLDWLMRAMKETVTTAEEAETKADNAIETANDANDRTLTYAQQIAKAVADAEVALGLARDAQDILVIYPDNEGKPVNYKKYINGETEYIGTDEILTELTLYKRIPFFMDRSQNIFLLNGSIDSGTTNTKIRFYRVEDGVFTYAIIDRNQTVSYQYSDSGFVPLSSADDSGKVLTVGSNGNPSWATPSGGGGADNAVLYVAQTLTEAQKRIARNNIGAGMSTVSYDETNNILTISANGAETAYNTNSIVWGYEDENSGNAVIRRRSDNSIYTASQMAADMGARKLILIETAHGLYYLSSASTVQGVSIATFFNGGTYTMVVDGNGIYNEMPVTPAIPEITNTETTIQTTIDPNKFYVFPNAGQLTIDFNPGNSGFVNEYHFRFTSGSTATQLDLPATVEIPDDFDVAANTVYEISIIDNYMVYSSWAVGA